MTGAGTPAKAPNERRPLLEDQEPPDRNTKKVRKVAGDFIGTQIVKGGVAEGKMGEDEHMEDDAEKKSETEESEEEEEENGQSFGYKGIKVRKDEDGLYNIVISKEVERKLQKPWWNSLIVKLLGRKMGYAAMKRRLETMW
ncbi:hypothetical protein PIB30_103658, partial [Stylosanthes scabra]|nr:hypothetical protein [Stylosanthes scabra]